MGIVSLDQLPPKKGKEDLILPFNYSTGWKYPVDCKETFKESGGMEHNLEHQWSKQTKISQVLVPSKSTHKGQLFK